MSQQNEAVTLDTFFSYDSHPVKRGEELRFLCPWCGYTKPRDNEHRCCCVNERTEIFRCWRCPVRGKLWKPARTWLTDEEYRKEMERKEFLALEAAREAAEARIRYRQNLASIGKIRGMGLPYLKKRGIKLETAIASHVKYSTSFYGGAALVFPMRDYDAKLRAMTCRYCGDNRRVTHRTVGDKLHSAFICEGALDGPLMTIVEAPFDALTLTQYGMPAIASCGSGLPTWLPLWAADNNMSVVLATDDDEKGWGDGHAEHFAMPFHLLGVQAYRMKPTGHKDWNNLLTTQGEDFLRDFIRAPDALVEME